MTIDIQTAARALMEAAERARRDALVSIEEQRIACRAIVQGYDEARERLALLDAEYARVEAQKSEDLARQALEAAQEQPKPEPYRAGLPPERLRKVWAEWEHIDGPIYEFQGSKYRWKQDPREQPWWDIGPEHTWSNRYRPHGATWARVEAMADEADRAAAPKMLDLRTVRDDSNHANPDVVMADADLFDAGETAATKAPLIRKGETFTVEREVSDHGKGPRVKVTREGQGQCYIGALQPAHVVPTPPAPTLLDLTKLPPGTVCEAVATVFSENLSRQMLTGTRFVIKEHASDGDALVESLDARQMWVRRLQPARVVKEGGEQ